MYDHKMTVSIGSTAERSADRPFTGRGDNNSVQLLQAAKWRQQQRGPGFKQRRLVVWEAAADDAESDEDEAGGMAEGLRSLLTGVRRKPVHVRDRTSGILRADRSEGESEGTSAPNLSTSPGLAGLDRARS